MNGLVFTFDGLLSHPASLYLAYALEAGAALVVLFPFRDGLMRFVRGHLALKRDEEVLLRINAAEIRRNCLLICVASFPVACVAGLNFWFALALCALASAVAPRLLVRRAQAEFEKRFDEALPDALSGIAGSLRAGLTIQKSLEVAAVATAPVFAREAEGTLKQYRLGASIDDALDGVRQRVKTPATNMSFGALVVGRRLGGPLPVILTRIADTVRERLRVEGKLRALTSQGRAQGVVLCGAPFVVGIGMRLFDAEKFALLTDTTPGQAILAVSMVLWIVGVVVTWKVMQLEI